MPSTMPDVCTADEQGTSRSQEPSETWSWECSCLTRCYLIGWPEISIFFMFSHLQPTAGSLGTSCNFSVSSPLQVVIIHLALTITNPCNIIRPHEHGLKAQVNFIVQEAGKAWHPWLELSLWQFHLCFCHYSFSKPIIWWWWSKSHR